MLLLILNLFRDQAISAPARCLPYDEQDFSFLARFSDLNKYILTTIEPVNYTYSMSIIIFSSFGIIYAFSSL